MATVTKVEFGKSSINPEGSGNDTDAGISSHGGGDGSGGGMLEKLERRVERLEADLTAARIDLTLIRERSENHAAKSELAILTERSDTFAKQSELTKLVERSESFASKTELARLVERSENFATKADLEKMANSINSRITWSVMIPLAVAVIGFVIKSFVFK